MNTHDIPDGIHPAHLAAAQARLSAQGRPMVEFLWRIDGTNVSLKSYLSLVRADGTPNAKAIALTRRWAPDWDGTDPYWFAEHLDFCRKYPVKLTVRNEPGWKDPSRTFACVAWVNPAHWAPPPRDTAAAKPDPIALDVAALAEAPEDLEPTMKNVWGVFTLLYAKVSPTVRDADWLALVSGLLPGKMQIDYTAEDWRRVLTHVRMLTHAHTCVHGDINTYR